VVVLLILEDDHEFYIYIYIYIASYNNSDIHILKKIKNKNTYKNLTNEKPSKRETIKIKKT